MILKWFVTELPDGSLVDHRGEPVVETTDEYGHTIYRRFSEPYPGYDEDTIPSCGCGYVHSPDDPEGCGY